MKQHIRDVRLETLSRIKQHSYYDEIQGLFETIAGHCEIATKKKQKLTIQVPHLGEFEISHRTLGDIEKAKASAQKAAATRRKQAAAKKHESDAAQSEGDK